MSEYFQKTKFTCASIIKLHLKSSRSSNSLQKPHTEPILCSDCIPIVVFDNPEEDNCSNTIDALSARLDSATVHYTTQNDFLGFPVPLFITNIFLVLKTDLGGQTYKKTRSIKDFSFLNLENTDPFVDRLKEFQRKTGWWWWPLTSYCDVKKRISAVPSSYYLGPSRFEKMSRIWEIRIQLYLVTVIRMFWK